MLILICIIEIVIEVGMRKGRKINVKEARIGPYFLKKVLTSWPPLDIGPEPNWNRQ